MQGVSYRRFGWSADLQAKLWDPTGGRKQDMGPGPLVTFYPGVLPVVTDSEQHRAANRQMVALGLYGDDYSTRKL